MPGIDVAKKILSLEKKHSLVDGIQERLPQVEFSVKIDNPDDLYSSFDPSPYEKRELSDDFVSYCLEKVSAEDKLTSFTIKLLLPENFCDEETVRSSVVNYFELKACEQFKSNWKTDRRWNTNFILGLFFLGLCLLGAHIFHLPRFDGRPFFSVLRESLSIIGWVAIWEPTGYFLFSRKENKKALKNFLMLHRAQWVVERI